jgi:hypothetical protein
MKEYTNGQRKGMMYGGAPRKPMMYGGKAKKMQMGGAAKKNAMNQGSMSMPVTSPMMPANPMPTAQQRTPMAMGSKAKLRMVEKDGKKVPFYAADGVGKMKHGGKAKKYGY